MMRPKEAVDTYITTLKDLGLDVTRYQFQVVSGKIRIGHVLGPNPLDVQWAMMWHTPEEFAKMARMRRLDVPTGNPKKPWSEQ